MKIYTDGACSGNPGPGGWALQAHHADGLIQEQGGFVPEVTTNNRMELYAVIQALELAWKTLGEPMVVEAARPLVLTDSKYVVMGLNEWLPAWQRRDFCKADGEEISNRDLWQEVSQLTPEFFRFKWVKGHSGDDCQERVDQLATDLSKGKTVEFFYGYVNARPPGRKYPIYLALIDGRLFSYEAWPDCQKAVTGKKGAFYKKIKSSFEENQVLKSWGVANV